jgi:hypothetical protein
MPNFPLDSSMLPEKLEILDGFYKFCACLFGGALVF